MEESNKISTIIQCFVDTNLELNENFPYQGATLLEASFSELNYSVEEDSELTVTVQLSEVSTEGFESVTIGFIPTNAQSADIEPIFPTTINWEVGETQKEFTFEIKKDAFIELNESFQLAIISASNCIPKEGESITTVSIEDTTILNRVKLVQNENSFVLPNWNGAQNIEYLSYEISQLSYPTFRLALDFPSEFGTEAVELKILNGTNITNSDVVGTQLITFDQGEQYKDVQLNPLSNTLLSNEDLLLIKLFPANGGLEDIESLSVSINFDEGYSEALLYVNQIEAGIQRKYTNIVFRDIFRQKGSNIDNKPIQLRSVNYNQGVNTILTDEQNNWLLRFGDTYSDPTDYEDNYPFPIYKWGLDLNGNPGELTMLIENSGEVAIDYEGETYNPGEFIKLPITSNDFQVLLPSNAGLVQEESEFSEFDDFTSDGVLTESIYSFRVLNSGQTFFFNGENQFYSHNFSPLNEQDAVEDIFNFGTHNLVNQDSPVAALANSLYMANKYDGALTRYNGGQCTSSFNFPSNVFNIRMLGFILLDANDNFTEYAGTEFIELSDFNPICGELFDGQSDPDWRGVEFEIYDAEIEELEAEEEISTGNSSNETGGISQQITEGGG